MTTLANENSCGQGTDPEHADNPYHGVIESYGYVYVHSTRVRTGEDDNYKILHTYKRGEHYVSVRPCNGGWLWAVTCSTASGREWIGRDKRGLGKHLRSKAYRYVELRVRRSYKIIPRGKSGKGVDK